MASKLTRAQKIAKNEADKRIERAYTAGCKNVEIDIMDIGKVFAYGTGQIAMGADDAKLQAGIIEFVETIRKKR
jgi:hypothetical protein